MASGRLILPLSEPMLFASGLVASGALLTVYEAGTDTLAAIYSDPGLTTPITNPQISNSAGRFYDQSTVIWADQSIAYDCTLNLTDGETLTYSQLYLVGVPPSITGFAPINSPTFTGVPKAPTPATNDSSAQLATTAFTQLAVAAAINALPQANYIKFGSTIIQWCRNIVGTTDGGGNATVTFTFPIPYVSGVTGYSYVATNESSTTFVGSCQAGLPGLTSQGVFILNGPPSSSCAISGFVIGQ